MTTTTLDRRSMLNQVRATFEHVAAYMLVAAIPVALVTGYLASRRMRLGTDRRQALLSTALDAATAMSLLLIVIVTLMPSSYPLGDDPIVNLVPFRTIFDALTSYDLWTSTPVRSLYFNLLLFVPLGFFLGLRRPIRFAALVGLMGSLVVEISQFLFLSGRATDVDDLILNTTGAVVGAITAKGILGFRRIRDIERRPSATKHERHPQT